MKATTRGYPITVSTVRVTAEWDTIIISELIYLTISMRSMEQQVSKEEGGGGAAEKNELTGTRNCCQLTAIPPILLSVLREFGPHIRVPYQTQCGRLVVVG